MAIFHTLRPWLVVGLTLLVSFAAVATLADHSRTDHRVSDDR